MARTKVVGLVIAIILCVLPQAARAQATFTGIKLLTRDTGWAARGGRLYWTTDFGEHWRDITPPGVTPDRYTTIADAFFLDASRGWALLRRTDPDTGGWGFDVAFTEDGGVGWSSTRLTAPSWLRNSYQHLGGGGSVSFADPMHGWIDLSLQSSPASELAVLLLTADGGRTWTWLEKGLGVAASLRFVSPALGWAAGGPVCSEIFVTHDGGNTWRQFTPEPPAGVGVVVSIETSSHRRVPPGGRGVLPVYGLPSFHDSMHGFLPVSYVRWVGGQGPEQLVVYSTADGGSTWTHVRVLTAAEGGTAGEGIPSAIADSAVVVATKRRAGGTSVAAVHLSAGRAATELAPTARGVYRLSFVDENRGWMLTGPSGPLLATVDGGASWTDTTPQPRARTREPWAADGAPASRVPPGPGTALPNFQPLEAAPLGHGGGGLHTSTHLGFDRLGALGAADMQTWWKNSPYYDVGFYLPGARVGDSKVTPS